MLPSGFGRTTSGSTSRPLASAYPRPCARNTTSPGPSATGSPTVGISQADPRSTTWNPAPSESSIRIPQGAYLSRRPECGRPARIAAIASLSTSMSATVAGS